MIESRPSRAESSRVFRQILRGRAVNEADLPAASAIVASFAGWRGRYWPSVVGLIAGIALLIVMLGGRSDVRHPLFYVAVAVVAMVAATALLYSTHRVNQFRASESGRLQGAVPVSVIDLAGCTPDFEKIAFAQLVHREAGLRLADAKHASDAILGGGALRVTVASARSEWFVAEASRLGIQDIKVE